ncbi:acyl-CoA thioesterase [Vibrio coralliilyticus]|uniref:acyl-CoA thioesterase n=1 Tax=Vibrio coralliilyticus TaxID=190893 RepID=UPI0015618560|nr:thioesterase family protein [Vibrio coralliilyticus]NRF32301.1 acyl-CoA thioesterase [Vibrio coralliilyticus]NRF54286.1 acyl-CoA thioesterase [Vibrio coralliilyticus]NRG02111.1 acyl-CoA thioesterase [Vibrio coralliilyticus]
MESLLKDFPVITEIPVAWGEMDALQHVNNVVYFRYFETARLDYFEHINLLVNLSQSHIGPVLGETSCRYKMPITYPDTLMIGSKVVDIQEDRFTMEYQVVSKKVGKVSTVGHATCVMFDFKNNCKANFPEQIKQSILNLEATAES